MSNLLALGRVVVVIARDLRNFTHFFEESTGRLRKLAQRVWEQWVDLAPSVAGPGFARAMVILSIADTYRSGWIEMIFTRMLDNNGETL